MLSPYLRTPPRVLLPESNSALTRNGVLPRRVCSTIVCSNSPYAKNTVQNDLQVITINLRYKKVASLTSLVIETFEVGTVAQTDKISYDKNTISPM